MEPETITTNSSGKKKILIAVVFVVAVAGLGFFFLRNQSAPLVQTEAPSAVKKEYTRAEKLKILESVAKNAPAPTSSSTADKLKILQALAASTGQ